MHTNVFCFLMTLSKMCYYTLLEDYTGGFGKYVGVVDGLL